MDFFSGYNSDASDKEHHQQTSDTSDDSGSDVESLDSAAERAAAADARLRDFEVESAGVHSSALPSAFSAFHEVDGPPAFLDPEATRPLATAEMHAREVAQATTSSAASKAWHGPKGRVPPGQEFDIAKLAPPLKGQNKKTHPDKRDMPASAVIEGKAKRYKADEGPEAGQLYTSAQIAMLGGNVDAMEGRPKPGPSLPATEGKAGKGPTPAMEVSSFLDKGVGAAQLPRKNQDRKEKEKQKRTRGQSTHAAWKSEAEMVLRQQYD